ncbi:hypothetical protein M6B38_254975 [Iris pallida]|uniref:Uncharacterized protein n=1 Tax=Iris pallida TaxID=29817 RepID=A0AAX6FQD5_IRIPA|nr:hypothetical protein M6B38_406340 [Iris pallida]KAJ6852294.1 hypothetical protein M6B38_254975 [Iris pallida]
MIDRTLASRKSLIFLGELVRSTETTSPTPSGRQICCDWLTMSSRSGCESRSSTAFMCLFEELDLCSA